MARIRTVLDLVPLEKAAIQEVAQLGVPTVLVGEVLQADEAICQLPFGDNMQHLEVWRLPDFKLAGPGRLEPVVAFEGGVDGCVGGFATPGSRAVHVQPGKFVDDVGSGK